MDARPRLLYGSGLKSATGAYRGLTEAAALAAVAALEGETAAAAPAAAPAETPECGVCTFVRFC